MPETNVTNVTNAEPMQGKASRPPRLENANANVTATLTQAGLTARLNDQGGLVVEGLGALPGPQAEALRRFIRENKALLVAELCSSGCKPEGKESQDIENIDKGQAEEGKTSKKTKPSGENVAAARDLIDLDRRGFIKLDLSGPAPAFTLADGQGYGPGDRDFVQGLIDEAGPALASMMPVNLPGPGWTESEARRKAQVEAGRAVVANMKTDKALVKWAKREGHFERIDRKTKWGNIYEMPRDGNREQVCDLHKAGMGVEMLAQAQDELKGKVLGCWCYPKRCHGDSLAALANHSG